MALLVPTRLLGSVLGASRQIPTPAHAAAVPTSHRVHSLALRGDVWSRRIRLAHATNDRHAPLSASLILLRMTDWQRSRAIRPQMLSLGWPSVIVDTICEYVSFLPDLSVPSLIIERGDPELREQITIDISGHPSKPAVAVPRCRLCAAARGFQHSAADRVAQRCCRRAASCCASHLRAVTARISASGSSAVAGGTLQGTESGAKQRALSACLCH